MPRTNRGIFCLNELPDLAERIQVSLLNVLEERDIGVRGYALRLPLDLILVASANPEDYTNRGRIITPLKDRFGAEIRTHYPLSLSDELALVRQEAQIAGTAPTRARRCPATWSRSSRGSPGWCGRRPRWTPVPACRPGSRSPPRSPPRPRAVRRAALTGETQPVARICDLPPMVTQPARQGRVRGQRGGPGAGGARAPAAPGHRRHLPCPARQRGPVRPARPVRGAAARWRPANWCPRPTCWRRVGEVTGLAKIMQRLGMEGSESLGHAAAAVEFALEGLYLMRRLSKDSARIATTRHRRCYRTLMQAADPEPAARRQSTMTGYRYGPYHDGPDPLAPPYDARRALDEMGDSVLGGVDPATALRDLLRRGLQGHRGLDDMLRRVRERQRGDAPPRAPRRHPGAGPGAAGHGGRPGAGRAVPRPQRRCQDARGRARRAARRHRAGDPAAGRLRLALAAARETFEQLKDLLRREVLDSQFRGMKEALENPDPEAMQRVKDMLADAERDAGGGRPGRAHPGGLRRVHGPLRGPVPRPPGQPGGAGRRAGPPGHGGRSG